MNKEHFKKQFILRDRIYRVISKDGMFRATILRNTNTAKTAQEKHNLTAIPAFYLARTLSAASLIAGFMKGEERIILNIKSSGLISQIYAEALHVGEVRGFIQNINNIEKLNYNSFSDLLLPGTLSINRIMYNKNEPVTGIIEMQVGDVTGDIANYFSKSDQIPASINLSVDMDNNGIINTSGGFIIQVMPGAAEKDIQLINDSLAKKDHFVGYLSSEKPLEDIMKEYFPFDYNILRTNPIDFFCRCSKENFITKIKTLGIDEIKDMRKDGTQELVCQYCNSKYYLDQKDFDRIIEELIAKNN